MARRFFPRPSCRACSAVRPICIHVPSSSSTIDVAASHAHSSVARRQGTSTFAMIGHFTPGCSLLPVAVVGVAVSCPGCMQLVARCLFLVAPNLLPLPVGAINAGGLPDLLLWLPQCRCMPVVTAVAVSVSPSGVSSGSPSMQGQGTMAGYLRATRHGQGGGSVRSLEAGVFQTPLRQPPPRPVHSSRPGGRRGPRAPNVKTDLHSPTILRSSSPLPRPVPARQHRSGRVKLRVRCDLLGPRTSGRIHCRVTPAWVAPPCRLSSRVGWGSRQAGIAHSHTPGSGRVISVPTDSLPIDGGHNLSVGLLLHFLLVRARPVPLPPSHRPIDFDPSALLLHPSPHQSTLFHASPPTSDSLSGGSSSIEVISADHVARSPEPVSAGAPLTFCPNCPFQSLFAAVASSLSVGS
jgi:hypothetical protein